ncbi:hypothetical protein IFM89_028899 [Coptis chinensis]|uniref:Reverse transcriptase domain-containing protein n=1 Tax=Coptis chinensis TaxID=261450 RepID=A0A835H9N2_9MAGN|nr:hypothetical protein IFM89_028899 [Coptis chinensis]
MGKMGFLQTWIRWIDKIISSAQISILINGGPCGFFPVSRGLRQGDALSPFLFALVEDTLSRGLTYLKEQNKIKPMLRVKDMYSPTHLLFADDILIF